MVGKLQAKAGKGDELAAILQEAAAAMKDFPACHVYIVTRDVKDADAIHVMEVWDSKEAHDESLKGEDTRAMIARAMPLLDGMPSGVSLVVLGGKGL